MSRFYYIASSDPLPLGARGEKKSSLDRSGELPPKAFRFLSYELPDGATSLEDIFDLSSINEEETAVYDSMEDAAGIYIYELGQEFEAIRRHFSQPSQPHVYGIAPNWGKFYFSPMMKEQLPEDYKACVKCVTTLFDLLREIGNEHTKFELYSCWVEEEQEARNDELTMTIKLSTFKLGDSFELMERQYIFIEK
ncbi:hypothetical protein [Paenibacillus radicis (ex Xue et al. 2023)]|uniref:Uncharacterized protein n=1 Tax=Paenibacillus radicis (ex Xue et al. 2023) TaxID=2972489 RepID=A0ABT1YHV9_9BACL|nr:hypothetical protein [Paenibacillus radicis (ex Xue et al. 2023)]MCR8632009.1 hypothetical protein [Paenibacillus radicis (ex Xue et al. 2023)]